MADRGDLLKQCLWDMGSNIGAQYLVFARSKHSSPMLRVEKRKYKERNAEVSWLDERHT